MPTPRDLWREAGSQLLLPSCPWLLRSVLPVTWGWKRYRFRRRGRRAARLGLGLRRRRPRRRQKGGPNATGRRTRKGKKRRRKSRPPSRPPPHGRGGRGGSASRTSTRPPRRPLLLFRLLRSPFCGRISCSRTRKHSMSFLLLLLRRRRRTPPALFQVLPPHPKRKPKKKQKTKQKTKENEKEKGMPFATLLVIVPFLHFLHSGLFPYRPPRNGCGWTGVKSTCTAIPFRRHAKRIPEQKKEEEEKKK